MDWVPDRIRKLLRKRDPRDSDPAQASSDATQITHQELLARQEGRSTRTRGIPESNGSLEDHSGSTPLHEEVSRPAWYQQAWSSASQLPGKAAGSIHEAYDGSAVDRALHYDLLNIPRGIGRGFHSVGSGIVARLGAAGGGIGKGFNSVREWGGRGHPYTLRNWQRVGLVAGGLGALGGGVAAVHYVLGLQDEVQEARADADYAKEALARVMQSIDGVAIELGEPFPRDNDYGLDAADFVGSLPRVGSSQGSFRYSGFRAGELSDEALAEEGLAFGAAPGNSTADATLAGRGMSLPGAEEGQGVGKHGQMLTGKAGVEHLRLIVDLRDYGQKTLGELIEEVIDCREQAGMYTPGEPGMPSAAECYETLVHVRTPDGMLQLTLGDLLDQYRDLAERQYGQQGASAAGSSTPQAKTFWDVLAEELTEDTPGALTSDAASSSGQAAPQPNTELTPEQCYDTSVDVQTPDGTFHLTFGELVDQYQHFATADPVDGRDDIEDLGPDTCGYSGFPGPDPNRTLEDACAMVCGEQAPLPVAPIHCGDGKYGGRAERTIADACATEPTSRPTTCGDGNYGGPDPTRTLEAACGYDLKIGEPAIQPIGLGTNVSGQGSALAGQAGSQGAPAVSGAGNQGAAEEDDGRLCLDGPLQNAWYNAIETIRTSVPQDQQVRDFTRLYGIIMGVVTMEGPRVFTRSQLYKELAGHVSAHPELYGVTSSDVDANRTFFEQKMGELRGYGPGKTFLVGGQGQLQGVDGLLIQGREQ